MNQLNFFSDNSPFLKHPLLTPERTAQEVDFVLAQLNMQPGARILDVGCGFGRHSVELARRGYQVVGIDPAAAMIKAARTRAREAGVDVDFRQVGGESFVAERPFDAAVCLFTTLGQISETGENSGLVTRVYQGLRPGGRFMVEVPQRETAVRQLKRSERLGGGERYAIVTRQFDAGDNTISELFEIVSPEDRRRYLLRYRLYSVAELTHLLQQAGFTVAASFAGYEGRPLQPDSPTMLLTGVKDTVTGVQ